LQAALAAPVPVTATDPLSSPQIAKLLLLAGSFISQVKINGIAASLIQLIKKAKAPGLNWIGDHTPWLVRGLAALAAALTAAGLRWTFTAGTLTVTGLSAPSIITFLFNTGQNFLFQHAWYRTLFSTPAPADAPAKNNA
jgi:hypothetical protein